MELVRAEGLEPPQLASLEPKPSASTSSATPAYPLETVLARAAHIRQDPSGRGSIAWSEKDSSAKRTEKRFSLKDLQSPNEEPAAGHGP